MMAYPLQLHFRITVWMRDVSDRRSVALRSESGTAGDSCYRNPTWEIRKILEDFFVDEARVFGIGAAHHPARPRLA